MIIHGDGSIRLDEKEYDALRQDQMKLQALMNHGVDNWDGYSDAMAELRFMLGEDEEDDTEEE